MTTPDTTVPDTAQDGDGEERGIYITVSVSEDNLNRHICVSLPEDAPLELVIDGMLGALLGSAAARGIETFTALQMRLLSWQR